MANLYFFGNSTSSQMFGCMICTDDKTIVFDGGTKGDHIQLLNIINQKAKGHIDAWFFTHPHHDHIGAFLQMFRNNPEIEIDKILFRFPSIELLKKYGMRYEDEPAMWTEFDDLMNVRFCDKVYHIETGDVFDFGEVKVNVLRVFNPEITGDFVNNSSAVYRIDSSENRILILGDLGVDGGEEVMNNCSAESLQADYTQLAHHGQGGVNEKFYQYIKPKRCLWASPEWLWNNDNGNGFDTGPWATVITRSWMEKLGVEEHFVEKDGTVEIVF